MSFHPFQGGAEAGVSGGRGGAGGRGGRLADGQARLPGLRQPRDPAVQHGVLGPGGRHVGARRHALHHARRKVRRSSWALTQRITSHAAFFRFLFFESAYFLLFQKIG